MSQTLPGGTEKSQKYSVSVDRLRTGFEARNFQIRSMLCYSLDSDVYSRLFWELEFYSGMH